MVFGVPEGRGELNDFFKGFNPDDEAYAAIEGRPAVVVNKAVVQKARMTNTLL